MPKRKQREATKSFQADSRARKSPDTKDENDELNASYKTLCAAAAHVVPELDDKLQFDHEDLRELMRILNNQIREEPRHSGRKGPNYALHY